jgi:hypothetical protein
VTSAYTTPPLREESDRSKLNLKPRVLGRCQYKPTCQWGADAVHSVAVARVASVTTMKEERRQRPLPVY